MQSNFDQNHRLILTLISPYYKNGNWDFSTASTEVMKRLFPTGNVDTSFLDSLLERMKSDKHLLFWTTLHFDYIAESIDRMGDKPDMGLIESVKNYRLPDGYTSSQWVNVTKEELLNASARENTLKKFFKELQVYKESVLVPI